MPRNCDGRHCYGNSSSFPFSKCDTCHEMSGEAIIVVWALRGGLVLVGLPMLIYFSIIKGSTATYMEIFWNILWAVGELVLLGGVLAAAYIFAAHRLKAYLKKKAIKDDWAEKQLEAASHHKHSAFVENLEHQAEVAKKLLTEGSQPDAYVANQWQGDPLPVNRKRTNAGKFAASN